MNLIKREKVYLGLVIIVVSAAAFLILSRTGACSGDGGAVHDVGKSYNSSEGSGGMLARIFQLDKTAETAGESKARTLTSAEKEENEREIRRMMQKIPGNLWIPRNLTEEEQKERRKMLRDAVVYGNRVRKGSATPEEKKRYYELKTKQIGDKIEFVQYVVGRILELRIETGREYLDDDDIEQSRKAIEEFKKEYELYKKELDTL